MVSFAVNELPEQIRAFIAVRLPEPSTAVLTELQARLKRVFRNVAWTRPEAMHLTLQFLGNIESARVEALATAVGNAVGAEAPFHLHLTTPGSFHGRVIWVELGGDTRQLSQLAEAVQQGTRGFAKYEEERAFRGHVTLGRLRQPWRGTDAVLAEMPPMKFEPWRVDHVELIRSELLPHGSRYATLAALPLGGKDSDQ